MKTKPNVIHHRELKLPKRALNLLVNSNNLAGNNVNEIRSVNTSVAGTRIKQTEGAVLASGSKDVSTGTRHTGDSPSCFGMSHREEHFRSMNI